MFGSEGVDDCSMRVILEEGREDRRAMAEDIPPGPPPIIVMEGDTAKTLKDDERRKRGRRKNMFAFFGKISWEMGNGTILQFFLQKRNEVMSMRRESSG